MIDLRGLAVAGDSQVVDHVDVRRIAKGAAEVESHLPFGVLSGLFELVLGEGVVGIFQNHGVHCTWVGVGGVNVRSAGVTSFEAIEELHHTPRSFDWAPFDVAHGPWQDKPAGGRDWILAFAGMTFCRLPPPLALPRRAEGGEWIPAFAGMTGWEGVWIARAWRGLASNSQAWLCPGVG